MAPILVSVSEHCARICHVLITGFRELKWRYLYHLQWHNLENQPTDPEAETWER
jgi:hypothetical protein